MLFTLKSNTFFLSLLCSSILHGLLCGYFAERRRCNPWIWFFIGMMCGICGLIVLFITTKKEPQKAIVKDTPKTIINPNFYSVPWYYVDSTRNQQGPIDFFSLQKLIQEKQISKENYIWCEEWDNWKVLQEVPSLYVNLITKKP
ncbi:MAG: DUF4339 domain-containing protein [Chlamydiales bacterium]